MSFIAAATVASVGLSAYGAYKSSKANKAQSKEQAAQAQRNAAIARRNAADIRERGKDAIEDQKKATIRSLSDVRAGSAGAGLAVDQAGTTPQELVVAMAQAGEIDVMRLKENIDREAQRAMDQGANFQSQAKQFEIQRRSYNPLLSGLTAGLGSAVRSGDVLGNLGGGTSSAATSGRGGGGGK